MCHKLPFWMKKPSLLGCDLFSKCCKTENRMQVPQVTAQHPLAKVQLASKSLSRSHNDIDDGTCCPGTGNRQSQPVAPVIPWFSQCAPLGTGMGSTSPRVPSSLLPPLALEGLTRRREEEGRDGLDICQRTLNLSLQFITATQTLV